MLLSVRFNMENLTSQYNQFVAVTELSGDEVSKEQIQRLCSKYYWARDYCIGKDVVEIACGVGTGLGYLGAKSNSIVGGDICDEILERGRRHYGDRIALLKMDAQALPFEDHSKDVLLLFEAVYYLPDPEIFFQECVRVLRPGGVLLLVSANKDVYAFNPSPHSVKYFGVVEFREALTKYGFKTSFYGDSPIAQVSLRQKALQPVKKLAVRWNLIPKTMSGKKLLKRLVFGRLTPMPAEIDDRTADVARPVKISANTPDFSHKVIFCEARLGPTA